MSRCLVLLLGVGCGAERGAVPEGVSCQTRYGADQRAPQGELDLVVAISDAPAMVAHRDDVARGLRQLAAYLVDTGLSLHVAVVADDPGGVATYLVDLDVPWFLCPGDCRTRNYTGALDAALAALGDVATTGAPSTPLLARTDHALDDGSFLAPGGYLGVLIIAATDDSSPGDPAGYVERLAGRVPPDHARFALATAGSTPRLDAFLAGDRWGLRVALADDWRDAFGWDALFKQVLPLACLEDADPTTCTASDRGEDLPHCQMAEPDRPHPATPLPCFWIRHNPDCPGELEPIVERRRLAGIADVQLTCTCLP